MNYEKLTLEKFKANLKEGRYQDITGARRAIGKAKWPESEKETARALAAKALGEPKTKEAKAKEPKPAAKEKVKAVKAAKTAPAAVAAKRGRKPKQDTTAKSATTSALPSTELWKVESLKRSVAIIGAASQAVNALAQVRTMDPKIDVSEVQDVVITLGRAVRAMDAVIDEQDKSQVNGASGSHDWSISAPEGEADEATA